LLANGLCGKIHGDQLYKPHHVLDMTNYITSLIDK